MSHDFQEEIAFLGITSSPAFVRAPEGNGCTERFVRLLKENLLWVRDFSNVEKLRLALIDFKHIYNENWISKATATKTQLRCDRNNFRRYT
jgi:putative transposase